MDVDFRTVDVYYFSDGDNFAAKHHLTLTRENETGAAGLYHAPKESGAKAFIGLNTARLNDPTKLVATIAHELGHVILLGGGRISRDDRDHEYLTDLITVFLGMGLFTANAAFQFAQWTGHSHQGWRASRTGYLSEEMFGYSLACFAWLRGDLKAKWATHLALNVGHHFKTSLRYLEKGGETRLSPLITAT